MNDSFFNKPQIQNLDGLKKAQGAQAYGKLSKEDRAAALGAGVGASQPSRVLEWRLRFC